MYVVEAGRIRHVDLPPAAAESELRTRLLRSNVVGSPSGLVVERSLLPELGGFDEELAVLADWDLYLRLTERAPCAIVREPLFAYALHPGNMQREAGARIDREHRLMRAKVLASDSSAHQALLGERYLDWRLGVEATPSPRLRTAAAYVRMSGRHPITAVKGIARLAVGRVLLARLRRAGGEVRAPRWATDTA